MDNNINTHGDALRYAREILVERHRNVAKGGQAQKDTADSVKAIDEMLVEEERYEAEMADDDYVEELMEIQAEEEAYRRRFYEQEDK